MKVVFFGTPSFAVPTLQALIGAEDVEIVGVVTQPDRRRGRGSQLMPSPVKALATEHGFPVWQPANIKRSTDTIEALAALAADWFVVIAYGQILSQRILDLPRYGCVNVHGSILPKYRGAAPIQWSIYDGDRETGITTMIMDRGMDTGDMLLTSKTPINLLDNSFTLAHRLAAQGAELLLETLRQGPQLTPIAQDETQATHARMLTKEDFAIDWQQSAWQIHNQVRAFYPNGVSTLHGQTVKILETIPLGDQYWEELGPTYGKLQQQWEQLRHLPGQGGEIVAKVKGLGAIVMTGDGLILIKTLKLPGKPAQSSWNLMNGNQLAITDLFS